MNWVRWNQMWNEKLEIAQVVKCYLLPKISGDKLKCYMALFILRFLVVKEYTL